MKGTKEITVCDTPNCGKEATMGKCQACNRDMCYKEAWGISDPAEGQNSIFGGSTMYFCLDCLAPILGQRVETKGVAK